jgi:predicted PurR-regulated permease PerM
MNNYEPRHYKIDITPRSFAVVAVGAAIIAALWLVRDFVLLVIVAVIIASFVNAGARILRKIRVPRILGVLLMYLIFIGVIAVVIFVFFPLLIHEISNLTQYLPASSPWIKLLNRISEHGLSVKTIFGSNGVSGLQSFWKVYVNDAFLNGVTTALHVVIDTLLVFVISFFLSIQEGGVNSFLRAITPRKYESYIIDLWSRVEHKIGYWFGGQFILALLAGIIGFIGFTLMGIPYALLLAILLTFLEFIPFGLTVGTIVITPIVFASQGVSLGVTVLIFMLVLNFLEANVFQPLIVHKTVGIPMLLVLISIVAWIELIGPIGAVIAIPFAVLVLEIIYDRERASLAAEAPPEPIP